MSEALRDVAAIYQDVLALSEAIADRGLSNMDSNQRNLLIAYYDQMGSIMREVTEREQRLQVYSFGPNPGLRGEVSRIIAKLRNVNTEQSEFIYYTQRAYELLFDFAYMPSDSTPKNHLIVQTPVDRPFANFAVHKIPNIDSSLENSTMCVLLRGALLPSMIVSKEIQEYSSSGYITPFELFNIRRERDSRSNDLNYVLSIDRSYFDTSEMDGRDLIFADPINATGNSFITIVNYLYEQNVRPRSIKFFTIISALPAALRVLQETGDSSLYTLWIDPTINANSYILPGLGDAGDRLNGLDMPSGRRDIIQLIADYGTTISNLYRSQVRKIEASVLRNRH